MSHFPFDKRGLLWNQRLSDKKKRSTEAVHRGPMLMRLYPLNTTRWDLYFHEQVPEWREFGLIGRDANVLWVACLATSYLCEDRATLETCYSEAQLLLNSKLTLNPVGNSLLLLISGLGLIISYISDVESTTFFLRINKLWRWNVKHFTIEYVLTNQ